MGYHRLFDETPFISDYARLFIIKQPKFLEHIDLGQFKPFKQFKHYFEFEPIDKRCERVLDEVAKPWSSRGICEMMSKEKIKQTFDITIQEKQEVH